MKKQRFEVMKLLLIAWMCCVVADAACGQETGDSSVMEQEVVQGQLVVEDRVLQTVALQDLHAAVSSTSCSQCHVGVETEKDGFSSTYLDLYAHGPTMRMDRSLLATLDQGSLPFGSVRIGNLRDQLLRKHLKLEDKPALVVVTRDFMQEDEENAENSDGNDAASLEVGDVILQVNGKDVSDVVTFTRDLVLMKDKSLVIAGIRQGERVDLSVDTALIAPVQAPYQIGVQVEEPSEALRSHLQLFANEGVIVTSVVEDSPASTAEIAVHDILLRADGVRLTSLEDLRKTVQASQGEEMSLTLMRAGSEMEVTVKPEQEQSATVCPGQQAAQRLFMLNHIIPNWHGQATLDLQVWPGDEVEDE